MDRSRASVDDLRRRLDEMEARLGENDRRDDALAASGAGREASLFKFRDDGFAMRSPNGRFLLVPHLRLQTVYTGLIASRGMMDTARARRLGVHAPARGGDPGGPRRQPAASRTGCSSTPRESPTIKDAYVQIGTGPPLRPARRSVQGPVRAAALDLQRRAGVRRPSRRRWQAFTLERDIGLMATGRPFAGRLQYELAVTNGAGGGPPQRQHRSRLRGARRRRAVGPLPPGEGDLEWHPRPRASFGVAGYYNLVPTDVRRAHRRSERRHGLRRRRPHRQRRDLAGGRRAEGAVARAPRCRPSGSAATRSRAAVRVAQLLGRLRAGELLRDPRPAAGRGAHRPHRRAAATDRRPRDRRAARRPHRRAGRRGERLPARPAA